MSKDGGSILIPISTICVNYSHSRPFLAKSPTPTDLYTPDHRRNNSIADENKYPIVY